MNGTCMACPSYCLSCTNSSVCLQLAYLYIPGGSVPLLFTLVNSGMTFAYCDPGC